MYKFLTLGSMTLLHKLGKGTPLLRADAASEPCHRPAQLARQEPGQHVSPHLPPWPVASVQHTTCINVPSGSDWSLPPFIGRFSYYLS